MKGARHSEEQIIAILKHVVAELTLDNRALKDVLSKNVMVRRVTAA